MRTAKSRGPDTPMLVSRATRLRALSRYGGQKARCTRESAKQPLKPFAQGRPGCIGHNLWFLPRALLHARGPWVLAKHPVFPAPSVLPRVKWILIARAPRARRGRSCSSFGGVRFGRMLSGGSRYLRPSGREFTIGVGSDALRGVETTAKKPENKGILLSMCRSACPVRMIAKCTMTNNHGSVPEASQRCNYSGNEDGIREIAIH
jgi:hypothetical protein